MADDVLIRGLAHSNHDFKKKSSLGKNIFTNAFPVALAQLMSQKSLLVPLITATYSDGCLGTKHVPTPWAEIIKGDPTNVVFNFETTYDGYEKYTHGQANRSDLVVASPTGVHLRPLEIKLVVAPTSSTARHSREKQSCELVVRPASIEQLAFSIADSYGVEGADRLRRIIADALEYPNDYQWRNQSEILTVMPKVIKAAKQIVAGAVDNQIPFALTALWRTKGQVPIFDDNAFDAFVWTNLAFIQLFIDGAERTHATTPPTKNKEITRPARSLVWLVNSLWDYTTQGSLNFSRVHSAITYGNQTDKAGSFASNSVLRHIQSQEFLYPRLSRDALFEILTPQAIKSLMPERRLDAAIAIYAASHTSSDSQ